MMLMLTTSAQHAAAESGLDARGLQANSQPHLQQLQLRQNAVQGSCCHHCSLPASSHAMCFAAAGSRLME
jgi:hypothetical protein